jgi:hypothetical protein
MTLDGNAACITNGWPDKFFKIYSIAADHSAFFLPSGRKIQFLPFPTPQKMKDYLSD